MRTGTTSARPRVEIRRSARRRRTVSAYRDGDTVVVLMPAGLSPADERSHVDDLLARLSRREDRRRPSDAALDARARRLRERYLPEAPTPTSVRFVDNQHRRWGSCTPAEASIRLSSRLAGMPGWVLDYVLMHELVHLIEPGHGDGFNQLARRFPDHDKAVGYFIGYAHGQAPAATSGSDDRGPHRAEPNAGEPAELAPGSVD